MVRPVAFVFFIQLLLMNFLLSFIPLQALPVKGAEFQPGLPVQTHILPPIPADIVDIGTALYTYEEMATDLQELQTFFPGQISLHSIGKSVLGKELHAVVLGEPQASKKILIQGSTHAREYMTSQLIMKQL